MFENDGDGVENNVNTYSVTIEVDEDVDSPPDELQARASDAPDHVDHRIVIDEPIAMSTVCISINQPARIRDLSNEVIETLCIHLDVPPYLSMCNWRAVAKFFKLESLTIEKIDSSAKPTESLLQHIAENSAQKLFDALAEACRIDTLFCIRRIIDSGKLKRSSDQLQRNFSSASTAFYQSSDLTNKTDYSKHILVTHYEDGEKEEANYRWFLKNIKAYLKNNSQLKVLDVTALEDDDQNFTENVHRAFSQVMHIVVCFSPSYTSSISEFGGFPQARTQHLIHNLMQGEFVSNGMRNTRFRVVIMPGSSGKDLKGGWASLTYQYDFPSPNIGRLFARLVRDPSEPASTSITL